MDVPFQGLILIGQVLPKLWTFIYQTNDKTRCCVGVAIGEEILSRVPHYRLQRTDFRIVMTYCIRIISRFLMRIYRKTQCPNRVVVYESEGTACVVV